MRGARYRETALMFRLIAALLCLLASLPAAADLAIINARIYPSPEAEPIARGSVVMREGRIVAVGPAGEVAVPDGVQVIDAAGGVVTAGFWNSHVHFLAPPLDRARTGHAGALDAALRDMLLARGFTTVFDIAGFQGNAAALKARIEAGEVTGPQILHVDSPFFPKDGTPVYVQELMASLGAPNAEVATPGQARQRARAQLDAGADYNRNRDAMIAQGLIKAERSKIIWQSDPLPNDAFAVSEALHKDKAFVARLQGALAEVGPLLKTQPGLMPPSYTGFINSDNRAYKPIRDAGLATGTLQPK